MRRNARLDIHYSTGLTWTIRVLVWFWSQSDTYKERFPFLAWRRGPQSIRSPLRLTAWTPRRRSFGFSAAIRSAALVGAPLVGAHDGAADWAATRAAPTQCGRCLQIVGGRISAKEAPTAHAAQFNGISAFFTTSIDRVGELGEPAVLLGDDEVSVGRRLAASGTGAVPTEEGR